MDGNLLNKTKFINFSFINSLNYLNATTRIKYRVFQYKVPPLQCYPLAIGTLSTEKPCIFWGGHTPLMTKWIAIIFTKTNSIWNLEQSKIQLNNDFCFTEINNSIQEFFVQFITLLDYKDILNAKYYNFITTKIISIINKLPTRSQRNS